VPVETGFEAIDTGVDLLVGGGCDGHARACSDSNRVLGWGRV
jgi:hypothetical protein